MEPQDVQRTGDPTRSGGVGVYCKANCSYCVKAKAFLEEHKLPFTEVVLDSGAESYAAERDALVARTGVNHRTFPFIFVRDTFVGGYSELVTAYETLRLHDLVKAVGLVLEANF